MVLEQQLWRHFGMSAVKDRKTRVENKGLVGDEQCFGCCFVVNNAHCHPLIANSSLDVHIQGRLKLVSCTKYWR